MMKIRVPRPLHPLLRVVGILLGSVALACLLSYGIASAIEKTKVPSPPLPTYAAVLRTHFPHASIVPMQLQTYAGQAIFMVKDSVSTAIFVAVFSPCKLEIQPIYCSK